MVISNVIIKMTSYLDEVIINDHLQSEKTVFYPRVNIDGAPEVKNLDYHCIAGYVNISISGLADNELIEDILFYVK